MQLYKYLTNVFTGFIPSECSLKTVRTYTQAALS